MPCLVLSNDDTIKPKSESNPIKEGETINPHYITGFTDGALRHL